ncbi:hypothetical protein ACWGTO_23395 [Mesorhizobium sp. PL10]
MQNTNLACHQIKEKVATSRINRRALLFHSGSAVMASTATALAAEPRRDRVASDKLRALIEEHTAAYAAFGEAVYEIGGSSRDYAKAGREEERALLAICAYPAISEGDRLAKAGYLLEIEARGEFDLPEHMQALLRSTMFKT